MKTIYADRAFESCKTALNEQGITLLCCDANSHVPFIERAIQFVKEKVRCVRSMLSKRIKRIPTRLMRELVMSTVKMINSIRRKGGVHPVMSPRQIITGRRMKLPPYPPGSCVYAVRGGTTNSVDNMRSFAALYLCPNDEGGGHFVYNIDTMQRCSACRVVGINKKPIPMPDNVIDTINKQASEETDGIEFADINLKTTVNDYQERGYDSDSDFEDDDKSYETSDDSTVDDDNDLGNEPDQLEEDQQQHFNVQEVNDVVNEDDSSNRDEGVGEMNWTN